MNINLSQLTLLRTLGETEFNVSHASAELGLSQPSASRKLKELEDEVGAPLVKRNGRRITGYTALGERLMRPVRDLSTSLSHFEALVDDHHGHRRAELTIATTHSQARYFLPRVISRFREQFPTVRIQLSQNMPADIARKVREGTVELGICTDRIGDDPDLDFTPGYRWSHAVLAPKDHPILDCPLTLPCLSLYPVLTYVDRITGLRLLTEFLSERDIALDVVLEAADTDVLKRFIRLGLGYGLIASMGYEPGQDDDLVLRKIDDAPTLTMGVAHRRGAFLSQPARAMLRLIKEESRAFERQIARQQL
jgi:LysR family cys regulon transcriptional activator